MKILDIIETKDRTQEIARNYLESVALNRGWDKAKQDFKFEKILDRNGKARPGYARLIIQEKVVLA